MPLRETEWESVTTWLERYLLNVVDPYTQLAPYFDEEFIAALPLGNISSHNARVLVSASRRDIQRQVKLIEVVTTIDEIRVRPEFGEAAEFLHRLREDARIHATQDPFGTRLLKGGTEAFIDREDLRETLRRFVVDPEKSVLLVDGEPDSGRSYTYHFLCHVGQHRGFRPARVTLSRTSTPRQVLQRLAGFVTDPQAGTQPFPSSALNDPLLSLDDAVHWVVGLATSSDLHFWLVLDECDKLDPHSDVWDLIGQLALAIYEHAAVHGDRAPRLVLLGYGRAMPKLPNDVQSSLCWDTARIVEPDDLRRFFDQLFHESRPARLDDADPAEIDGFVEEAVTEVLHAAQDDDGESYMRRLCTATEKAIDVYRSF
ncbi:hypothetical protein [Streptomyces noursei]|uniref:hypothetical protein n=1 Tax=Streptomyces noursei TaxID=1971 RepID=UPI001674E8B2|nr:hypothetical protein [Streptomyces noursei]MCZ1013706.1 hypothetical protein [Streptomyces noursei]GGX24809.1 hypothetical protein GCM10010341_52370 [Streptomyces noursei]